LAGKWLIVVLSLGLDNLMASAAIGAAGMKNRLKLSLIFALFEGLMPAVGLLMGTGLGSVIGVWGYYAGLAVMAAIGVYMLFEDEDDEAENLKREWKGWALLAAGLAISLDELAVGFSFGLLEFPALWTVLLMAAQAFVMTWIGVTFGAKLRPYMGEAAEKAAGIVLIAAACILFLLQIL